MPVTLDYHSKIVFITGGGRGIGLAITTAFARAGATIIITYTSKNPQEVVKKLTEEHKVPIHVYHCPGEDTTRVNKVIDLASKEVGEVDIVVPNAGVSLWRDCVDMTDSELDWIMKTNLYAPITLCRGFVRHWLGMSTAVSSSEDPGKPPAGERVNLNKRILCVSSISGIVNMNPQRQMAYNVSKAGLTMACKSLAGEWAKYGVTINSISPGYVATDMIKDPPPGEGREWAGKWRKDTPVDRFADASEIGQMVVLMCSSESSSFMTGHDLVIDGGKYQVSLL
ncbi:2,4-dienoyl-CoA reductase [Kwoniella mangroviensis CBS 8886]|nr:2,4-dienoyl-CoA reductase [Kwoniella mangroviensis CBS 8886]